MRSKITLALSIIIVVASCKSKQVLTLTESDADRARMKYPTATLASLQEGEKLYAEHCDSCHGLKSPGSRTAESWAKIIPPMSKKAKIDAGTQELITQYLLTACDKK